MFKYLKSKKPATDSVIRNVKELDMANIEDLDLTEAKTKELAHIFHLLGDTTRLKIMLVLAKQRVCVGDIAHKTKFSISLVSHNLRLLKTAEMVKAEREGKKIYYTIHPDATELIRPLAFMIQRR